MDLRRYCLYYGQVKVFITLMGELLHNLMCGRPTVNSLLATVQTFGSKRLCFKKNLGSSELPKSFLPVVKRTVLYITSFVHSVATSLVIESEMTFTVTMARAPELALTATWL